MKLIHTLRTPIPNTGILSAHEVVERLNKFMLTSLSNIYVLTCLFGLKNVMSKPNALQSFQLPFDCNILFDNKSHTHMRVNGNFYISARDLSF